MQGVPSALILRNQSWVRKQAQAFMRHLPSNVEKADLIQVGLIGVAQAALSFVWEGDRETEEAKEAFVRYARMRVKGAMLDELRQRDHLGRAQRRKVKVIEVSPAHEPATAKDEVEARVDTGMLMRRLEKFFATLPERERLVIDSYLGVGMTPVELAQSLEISASRVSQLFRSVCERIGIHLGHTHQRSTDRVAPGATANIEEPIALREAELARSSADRAWSQLVEEVLAPADDGTDPGSAGKRLAVTSTTRWG